MNDIILESVFVIEQNFGDGWETCHKHCCKSLESAKKAVKALKNRYYWISSRQEYVKGDYRIVEYKRTQSVYETLDI